MPLLLRTRARHLPRSARQLLHPASSHAASARISVLFRAPQPARARTALRRHPHNGIPISIGARFSSINPIRPGPGHAAIGQRSLFTGPTRIDSFSIDLAFVWRGLLFFLWARINLPVAYSLHRIYSDIPCLKPLHKSEYSKHRGHNSQHTKNG